MLIFPSLYINKKIKSVYKGDLKNVYLDFLIFFLYMVVALIKAVEDYEVQNPITK